MSRLIIHFLAALFTLAPILYLAAGYASFPEQIPMHWARSGMPDQYAPKTPLNVFFAPLLAALMQLFLGMLSMDLERARDAANVEGKRKAVRASLWMMEPLRLLLAALLGLISIQIPMHASGVDTAWVRPVLLTLAGAVAIVAIGGAVFGSRLQREWPGPPLIGGVSGWKWGVFYYNPANADFLVPKRFGIGFTFNFGHPRAKAYLLLLVATIVFMAACFAAR